ncbi:MAG: deoxyribose-phosphate aldolase [Legionellales bacterium]|nr:deoxyribose-phosphate aldolase [Legionellales bacterium]
MFDTAHLISLLDLTSLNDSDNDQTIQLLCQRAQTPLGSVAAVCVYPRFVSLAKALLSNKSVAVATVVNFPMGTASLDDVIIEISSALAMGADEIDIVIPYQDCVNGDINSTVLMVKTAKAICSGKWLKVILETGAFPDDNAIFDLSCQVLQAGADFIKTSTGKIAVGATLEAAESMLRAISATNPLAGLKVSGGIKTQDQAMSYLSLAFQLMGKKWCTPKHIRFGASSLLDDLLG